MARRPATATSLAEEAGIEADEALVSLWVAGIDVVKDVADRIPTSRIRDARRAVGLPDPKELKSPAYWRQRLHMDEGEFAEVLEAAGITMSPSARNLPRGAIRKLRQLERRRFGSPRPVVRVEPTVLEESPEPFKWHVVGHEREIRYLEADEVRNIHFLLVRDFATTSDPIDPPGLRSDTLLESAVFRQHTSLGETAKYPSVEMAAAALLHSLVNDHPFHNGNKRTGLVSMAVLLYENGLRLTCSQDALFKEVLLTAQHRLAKQVARDRDDREVLALAEWIRLNTRRISRGERIIKWHKLKRILSSFNVSWESPGGVGNRLNLMRKAVETTRALRRRTETVDLRTQVAYVDDGTDVPKNTVNKIRHDLHLDEEHGVDSASFYEQEDKPEDFIVEYQRTLRRLAKL